MKNNKLEWTSCIIFMIGVIIVVSGFSFEFKVDAGDLFNALVVIVGVATILNSNKLHRKIMIRGEEIHNQQLKPYLNYYSFTDLENGNMSLGIENVGGSFAIIKSAYLRRRIVSNNYEGYFQLSEYKTSFSDICNGEREKRLDDKNNLDEVVFSLYQSANETFKKIKNSEEKEIHFTTAGYRFKKNNALGKDKTLNFLTIEDKNLKMDCEYPDFRQSLIMHFSLLELFIEYESVTGERFYLPNEASFKELMNEIEKDKVAALPKSL